LCTELFNAIIPTLTFCSMLICYPYISLHFNVFYSCKEQHLLYENQEGVWIPVLLHWIV